MKSDAKHLQSTLSQKSICLPVFKENQFELKLSGSVSLLIFPLYFCIYACACKTKRYHMANFNVILGNNSPLRYLLSILFAKTNI